MGIQLIVLEDGVFPETGDVRKIYLNSVTKKYYIYTGGNWKIYPMIGIFP